MTHACFLCVIRGGHWVGNCRTLVSCGTLIIWGWIEVITFLGGCWVPGESIHCTWTSPLYYYFPWTREAASSTPSSWGMTHFRCWSWWHFVGSGSDSTIVNSSLPILFFDFYLLGSLFIQNVWGGGELHGFVRLWCQLSAAGVNGQSFCCMGFLCSLKSRLSLLITIWMYIAWGFVIFNYS